VPHCWKGAAAKNWCSCVYCDKLVQPAYQNDKWCTVVGVNQLGFPAKKNTSCVSEVELIDATSFVCVWMPAGRAIETRRFRRKTLALKTH